MQPPDPTPPPGPPRQGLPPPPGLLPPPPPAAEPSRRATWLAFGVVLALVAAIGVAASTDGPSRQAVPPSAAAAISPSSSPTRASGYGFLDTRSNGEPIRWPQCDAIHYVVNVDGAPANALADAKEAVTRVSDASQIPWVFDGTTSETPEHRLGVFSDGPGDRAWPAVLIAWMPHRAFLSVLEDPDSQHILGFGLPAKGIDAADADSYVSGMVVLDADQRIPRGFGTRYSRGMVLMHELAHVLGLAHVHEPDELMYAGKDTPPPQKDWGDGDLAGLAAVGRDPTCP